MRHSARDMHLGVALLVGVLLCAAGGLLVASSALTSLAAVAGGSMVVLGGALLLLTLLARRWRGPRRAYTAAATADAVPTDGGDVGDALPAARPRAGDARAG